MSDTTPLLSAMTLAEDSVSRWLNGSGCQITKHEPATNLEKLLMLKFLRMDMPHQSTQIHEIERAIEREARAK